MADTIRLVEYFYVMAPQKPGVGAALLAELQQNSVNLLAFSGFPSGRGAQVDFVPEDAASFRAVAKKAKWKLKGPKRALMVVGDDRAGAVADIMRRLAEAKINVTALDAVCAGSGRYGAILWMSPASMRGRPVAGGRVMSQRLALHTWTLDVSPLADALRIAKATGGTAWSCGGSTSSGPRSPAAGRLGAGPGPRRGLPVACVGVEFGWMWADGRRAARGC